MKTMIKAMFIVVVFFAAVCPLFAAGSSSAKNKALELSVENVLLKKEITTLKAKNAELEKQAAAHAGNEPQQKKKLVKVFKDINNLVYDENDMYVKEKIDSLKENVGLKDAILKFSIAFAKKYPNNILTIYHFSEGATNLEGDIIDGYGYEITYIPSFAPKVVPDKYFFYAYTQHVPDEYPIRLTASLIPRDNLIELFNKSDPRVTFGFDIDDNFNVIPNE